MADFERNIDTGMPCDGAGIAYSASLYHMQGSQTVRQMVELGQEVPDITDPPRTIHRVLERSHGRPSLSRVAAVALFQWCIAEEHNDRTVAGRLALERLASFALVDNTGDLERWLEPLGINGTPELNKYDIGRVKQKPDSKLTVPVIYLPATDDEQRTYPVTHRLRTVLSTQLPPQSLPRVAVHGRLGDIEQQVVRNDL